MPCDITSGISLQCRDNVGGLKNLYILSGSISSITDSNGSISSIAGTGTYYKFELNRNVGDFTETPTPSLENGTVFYDQVVNAAFPKLSASLRNQVQVLTQNPNLSIIIETENGSTDFSGQFFLVGQYRGATVTGGAGTTGTAFGDANQYALTFGATEPYPAQEIDANGDLVTALSGITVA